MKTSFVASSLLISLLSPLASHAEEQIIDIPSEHLAASASSKLQEIYRQAGVSEATNNTEDAISRWTIIVERNETASPYFKLAKAKLCLYDAKHCDTPMKDDTPTKTVQLFTGVEKKLDLSVDRTAHHFVDKNQSGIKAEFSEDRKSVSLTAAHAGLVSLRFVDANDKPVYDLLVDVMDLSSQRDQQEIIGLLQGVDGISVKIANQKVIVDGTVMNSVDLARIDAVVGQYGPTKAASLVTVSMAAQKPIAHMIANDINDPEITVRAVNNQYILEGKASAEDRKRAELITQAYLPTARAPASAEAVPHVLNLIVVPQRSVTER